MQYANLHTQHGEDRSLLPQLSHYKSLNAAAVAGTNQVLDELCIGKKLLLYDTMEVSRHNDIRARLSLGQPVVQSGCQ